MPAETSSLTRIAVGVDFSPESYRAVDHAMAVARHTGASLVLIHVGVVPDTRPDDPWREVLRERLAEQRVQLGELRERLSRQGVEVSHVVADGFADTALADAARELGADLIALGTHGRTGARRILLGSVAEKTARLASASVLVARGDASPGGYRRVVVGTDYSPLADRALERGLALTASGGEVRVVHAWSAPYVEYDLGGRALEALRETAEVEAAAERERILALPRRADVTLKFELSDGAPFSVLDSLSAAADLVVVGSHGRRGVRRFFLGSVAEATIRHAHCSVLVAR
jgi:nucleotide-binding universal stress UspA family protein